MMLLLALLVGQPLDLCTTVKKVVRTSVKAFDEVRGSKKDEDSRTVTWTAPLKLPGAAWCEVTEYKSGAQPFYACELARASCAETEEKFVALAKEVSTCLDAPVKTSDEANKRTVRLHKGGVPVRLTLTRGDKCRAKFLVEPIRQDK